MFPGWILSCCVRNHLCLWEAWGEWRCLRWKQNVYLPNNLKKTGIVGDRHSSCLTQPPAPRFSPSLLPYLREMSDREVPASWAGNDSDTNSDMWGFFHTKTFCETSWRSYNSMNSSWHWTCRQHQIPQVKCSVWLDCPSLPSVSSLKFKLSPVILTNVFRWKLPMTLH